MPEIKAFESIPADTPEDRIFIRLGYKQGKTQLNDYDRANLNEGISRGLSLCVLKGALLRLKITDNDMARVTLENGTVFNSAKLAVLLMDCKEAVLMGSTAGNDIITARDAEMKENAPLGVVLDAVGSETADYGLDWISAYINTMLRSEGKMLTKRFSPGYGDLELSAQKDIYNALDFGKFDVDITPKFILKPEKSVLAIAGVANS